MRASFLESDDDDRALELANEVFWNALVGRIRADGFARAPRTVLDVGSHRGGLLNLIAALWAPQRLFGIEPIAALRQRALLRLRGASVAVEMLEPAEWGRIPNLEVDLLVAFESLHLIADLDGFFDSVARVLASDGRAYIVLGCHSENPVWSAWKSRLEAMGHRTTTHRPLDIMRAGAVRGLLPSVRPLRDEGWVTHDPREPDFTFESVEQMLAHHFKHKLIFRFMR